MATREAARSAKHLVVTLCEQVSEVNGVGLEVDGSDYNIRVDLLEEWSGLPAEMNGVPIVARIVGKPKALEFASLTR